MSVSLAALDRPRIGSSNTIVKSGHLRISSKGLGWKSWKKRWFILTRTSLVFFKNDPNSLPQRAGDVNLTLGGIDINNSGSVFVREDKKLLTVLFPDGRDGRAFTLKAETSEDLYEWKTALEHALAQAPSAALVMGNNGTFPSDTSDTTEGTFHQWKDNCPVKSLVVGCPILLALEDIDGGPSFLEKALQFLEKHGIKVEGILRQSADVEEVDWRIQEYEKGKIEFGPDEDAHVIGDCVKYVLRELPSSPVPASCCSALLEAYKIDWKDARVNAMRSTIQETFPEPNRCLLQRVLKMMHTISSHASKNRMTPSAVAACMAPLLLRPLVAGECELHDINGDNSAQLLAAANAASNAQAIIKTLLEEYENIFNDDSLYRCSISAGSQTGNSESEDTTDNENHDLEDNGYPDAEHEVYPETHDDHDHIFSRKLSESIGSEASELYDYKGIGNYDSDVGSPRDNYSSGTKSNPSIDPNFPRDSNTSVSQQLDQQKKAYENLMDTSAGVLGNDSQRCDEEIFPSVEQELHISVPRTEFLDKKPVDKLTNLKFNTKRSTFWGSENARKTPSMESIDSSGEEELSIQRLEVAKNDLRQRIAKEERGNAILQASLERRKQALHERRLALEQDVARLQEQLQAERDLRAALEVGLSMTTGHFSGSQGMDSKTRAELEEIALAEADVTRLKQKVAELHHQLNRQRLLHYGPLSVSCDLYQHVADHSLQEKYFQQNFDTTLASSDHARKQRNEVLDYPSHPSAASSTLVELTTRLDFFKERRFQLMEQLHNLDLNYGTMSQNFEYKPSSPAWI
ncbi:rho GTPase-activating 7-like isoform X1 [Olea europaea subsp. europaea]|uniref:Rho GTPase-activating 7-like isoform X1 n=1 Tax=Olea europaea subsp. europaea TaxID=158383 RepID=A0A8S0SGL9_OLEEU|nr:rho GTPase-activating 7-like isoform X1 [Olea europaea subsp. europaea]